MLHFNTVGNRSLYVIVLCIRISKRIRHKAFKKEAQENQTQVTGRNRDFNIPTGRRVDSNSFCRYRSHTTGFANWRFLTASTGKYDRNGKLAIYFTPGSRFAYSGEGYALLQMVVEKIIGKNLEELAEKNVFQPIGMERTSYIWQPI